MFTYWYSRLMAKWVFFFPLKKKNKNADLLTRRMTLAKKYICTG